MINRESQFEHLARMIRNKSRQKVLEWGPSNYANSYQTSLGKGIVLITHNEEDGIYGSDPVPEYSLSFINSLGATIHSIHAILSSDNSYEMLKEIYDLASDYYLMTDETYQSMMDDIMKK